MNLLTRTDQDHVAILTLHHPPINSFSLPLRQALWQALQQIEQDPTIKGVVLTGQDLFSAGADIKEFSNLKAEIEPNLRTLIHRINHYPKWVAVAISGLCMGGAFELALGAHLRVAHEACKIALPEVKLGLLPGAGGTQRLPRLIGLEAALNFMIQGATFKAREWQALFDALVEDDGVAKAVELIRAQSAPPVALSPKPVRHPQAEAFLKFAENSVKSVAPRYPAPLKIIECLKIATTTALADGLAKEAVLFEQLMLSPESRALRHLFFAERAAGKVANDSPTLTAPHIDSVGIVGAGTMGSGIAIALLQAAIPVVLVDQTDDALARGRSAIERWLSDQLRKHKFTEARAQQVRGLLTLSTDWNALQQVDLAIEAVFEDLAIKQSVFEKLDAILKPSALLASNTSTLDINALAAKTRRPQQVLGLHFFSPAHVMKLLEVVKTNDTAPEVLKAALALAKRIHKIAVIAGVCDGFIGNRMVIPYLRMAEQLVEEGATPAQVDSALEAFGMVMGPFKVADLAGLDIGYAIRRRLRHAHPQLPKSFSEALVESKRLGQKVGLGWYRYDGAKRKPLVDEAVLTQLATWRQQRRITPRTFTAAEIVERCIFALINEGAKLLGDGIAERASDIDLVYIYGYGFPPFRGGPLYYAQSLGSIEVLSTLTRLAHTVDPLYTPAPLWQQWSITQAPLQ